MGTSLKDHKYNKGVIRTPMNSLPNIQPVSWKDDRLPEYLWLGLILMGYSRTEGIEKAGNILKKISQADVTINKPKLSEILNLSEDEQEKIFKIIIEIVDKKNIAPLTVIFKASSYPVFNKYFNVIDYTVIEKVELLCDAIHLYYNHQSNEATDLRFVVLSMLVFQGKLKVNRESTLPEIFENYPYTSHDDDKMKSYRPSIRATENIIDTNGSPNRKFISLFWKEIGLKSKCKLLAIGYEKSEHQMDYREYIVELQEKINHLIHEKKELSLLDDKFDVLVGTITYVLKIFNDIVAKDLDNSILGRHAYRTILESYINMKYLLSIDSDSTKNVWLEYKLYGIGKYKFSLLKERENNEANERSHFENIIIDTIVNEILWDEFVDIDLRYFDNKKIKDKFIDAGEEHLYNVLYEYDNNFIHGFWGAVRESSMLCCDNSAHRYHSVPDINFEQKVSSISYDIYKIINNFFNLINDEL
ncbi:hypothetical protein B4919_09210 [Francisella tularensis subsp. novicida]|uniref:DUF5677 domain-containing protein n=1 Tax=Francisella tularensis TaxID=263 RepID=UPI000CE2A49C|nr:DUF5677 domain-containing protein [Francisella tularensis]AVC44947.1 hypothetical protein B4919_09210 [Francisella tularensis subsp. novicida]